MRCAMVCLCLQGPCHGSLQIFEPADCVLHQLRELMANPYGNYVLQALTASFEMAIEICHAANVLALVCGGEAPSPLSRVPLPCSPRAFGPFPNEGGCSFAALVVCVVPLPSLPRAAPYGAVELAVRSHLALISRPSPRREIDPISFVCLLGSVLTFYARAGAAEPDRPHAL